MATDVTRQRQQTDRLFERQLLAVDAPRQCGSAWLWCLLSPPDLAPGGRLFLAVLTQLHVQSVRPSANGNFFTGVRMLPESAHALFEGFALVLAGLDREAPGVLAVWIVGAANEAAVAPELQAEAAVAAGRAGAWIRSILAWRKEMRPQVL